MAKLVHQRAVYMDPDTGEAISYWPERWPLSALAELFVDDELSFWMAYMCEPSASTGATLSIDWLHYYIEEDREQALKDAGITEGTFYAGIDTTLGGQHAQRDWVAMILGEKIGPRTFLRDIKIGRWKLIEQAEQIRAWLEIWRPHICAIEDVVAEGYIYNALKDSEFNFEIVSPEHTKAGAKIQRFLGMAPRFNRELILVPAHLGVHGEVEINYQWKPFRDQWVRFPTGHDDILDAVYWMQYMAYRFASPADHAEPLKTMRKWMPGAPIVCERPAHLAYTKPVDECYRCTAEYALQPQGADRRSRDPQRDRPIGVERRPSMFRQILHNTRRQGG